MYADDYEELFSKRLSKLRTEKGISQRDMSLSLGQNVNYINAIENRKNFPSMTLFFYICEYLGVTPMEFFNIYNENSLETSELIYQSYLLDKTEYDHVLSIVKDITKGRRNK